MVYNYINMDHITRAMMTKDTLLAVSYYKQFLDQGQYSLPEEYIFLGNFNYELGDFTEAERFYLEARKKNPYHPQIDILLNRTRRHFN